MKKILVLTLIFSISFVYVFSCDCKLKSTVAEEVKSTDLVVHGRVIKTQYRKTLNQDKSYLDTLSNKMEKTMYGLSIVNEYTVVVKTAFKGSSINDTITIRTRLDPVTDCGLILKVNTDYIFYAYKIIPGSPFYDNIKTPLFTTTVCNRTTEYSKKEITEIKKST